MPILEIFQMLQGKLDGSEEDWAKILEQSINDLKDYIDANC